MTDRLRYGILGTGNIARQFADGVAGSRRSVVTAVASRSQDSADAFAGDRGIERAYASYDALLSDRNVQAVYISLPNSMHHEWTLKCLAAGKHVLCEKPIASDAQQATEMFDAAQRAGLVLMEAFMYRCHPQTHAIVEQVRSGAIGKLKLIRTAFCFRVKKLDGNIRFDASLAGGALMDIGCYCVNFSRLFAGSEPVKMHAVGRLHASGVDEYTSAVLEFPGGVLATFTCGMTVQSDNTARVCGNEGYLEVPWPWKPPVGAATYAINAQIPPRQDGDTQQRRPREQFTVQSDTPLFGIEADAFAAAVLDGAQPHVTRADSLGNMRVLDELRRQVGVKF